MQKALYAHISISQWTFRRLPAVNQWSVAVLSCIQSCCQCLGAPPISSHIWFRSRHSAFVQNGRPRKYGKLNQQKLNQKSFKQFIEAEKLWSVNHNTRYQLMIAYVLLSTFQVSPLRLYWPRHRSILRGVAWCWVTSSQCAAGKASFERWSTRQCWRVLVLKFGFKWI